MIRLIEALGFRSIKYVKQRLDRYQVIIGDNASGKSNFLDIISFLGRLASTNLKAAVDERALHFPDLTWRRAGRRFELALEADIPAEHQRPVDAPLYNVIRYEIAVGLDERNETRILDEQITLIRQDDVEESTVEPTAKQPPATIFRDDYFQLHKHLIANFRAGELHVYPEESADNERLASDDYLIPARPHPHRSILGHIEQFQEEFPAARWLVSQLTANLHEYRLDSSTMRQLSRHGQEFLFTEFGAKLPWAVVKLRTEMPERYRQWLSLLRSTLSNVVDIQVRERESDKQRQIVVRHADGTEMPAGFLSEGTLRLLTLTCLAHLADSHSLCVIEGPENNLHPLNVNVVVQALQSVISGQVILVTYSPIVLESTRPGDALVFSFDDHDGTSIVRGSHHPNYLAALDGVGFKTQYISGELS